MATTANSLSNEARSISRVEYYISPDDASIKLHVDGDKFDIIEKNKETGDFNVTPGNILQFKKSVLVAQLVAASPEFADYLGVVSKISPQILAAFLRKATLVFDHTFVAEGDTVTQYDGEESAPFEHDGYSNTVKKIQFSSRVLEKMEEVFDKVVDLELEGIFKK